MATTIYRATTETETGIPTSSCWTEDRDVAAAYTDNPGFGGSHVRELAVELDNVLDMTGGFRELAEALGLSDDAAQEWRDNGWLYPWEESSRIRRALSESGYEWLRYVDDYPEGAVTLMRIT